MEPKKIALRVSLFYTLLITIAFLLPASGKLNLFKLFDSSIPIDKILHVIIHLILAFLWLNVIFIQNNQVIKVKLIAITVLSCVFYGIIVEILQEQLINSRRADFMDVIANSVGTLLGFLLFLKVKFRFNS